MAEHINDTFQRKDQTRTVYFSSRVYLLFSLLYYSWASSPKFYIRPLLSLFAEASFSSLKPGPCRQKKKTYYSHPVSNVSPSPVTKSKDFVPTMDYSALGVKKQKNPCRSGEATPARTLLCAQERCKTLLTCIIGER